MNNILSNEIIWPVLRFASPDCCMVIYDSDSRMTNVSLLTLNKLNNLTSSVLIDSAGTIFELTNPKLKEKLSFFKKILNYITNKQLQISYTCVRKGKISIEELCDKISEDYIQNEEFWQGYDLDKLIQKIKSKQTVKQVIEFLKSNNEELK